jgi:hypothetical protein
MAAYHRWFEKRGPEACLIAFIHDANQSDNASVNGACDFPILIDNNKAPTLSLYKKSM